MKLNDTVARIVEIMFQDVEMNEETSAIRDEVMDNCQARYTDLIASGMNEDDAIAAVIESLKGMEDVLAPYKRKQTRPADTAPDSDEMNLTFTALTFAAEEIHRIDLTLVSENVTVEASPDDSYHVFWNAEENPHVAASVLNGVLRVERLPGEEKRRNDKKLEATIQGDIDNLVRTEKGKIEINLDSLDSMFKSIGQTIKSALTRSGVSLHVQFGDSRVTIQVPERAVPHVKLLTTSGDIDVQQAALADLNVISTSGDIDVDLTEDQSLSRVELRTTSGDIEVCAYVEDMSVASTSGDVDVEGRADRLNASTISGDIDVRAEVQQINFKAVSGDAFLEFESLSLREVCGSTVSGDIDMELPDGFGAVDIHTQTRSGDVTTRYTANGVGPTVSGGVTTLSGDINIR
ncbi:MAG: DUF4097 family beta strand repeat-containing protein [Clostridiales bacterium]|nr:DUF4097 family beta strand repeat-containing protein [Clostridiales bacterium]